MTPTKIIIEGLDRLGKSTLIEGIRNQLGYFEIVHYQKPQLLDFYADKFQGQIVKNDTEQKYRYQRDSFHTMFQLLKSDANIILDRAHLGEMVYAPIYRGYSGDYVLDLEHQHQIDEYEDIRLILLTEDFEIANHFVDDGDSLGGVEQRAGEQARFIDAFNKSIIKDKRIICVTDPALGGFKPKDWIIREALEEL